MSTLYLPRIASQLLRSKTQRIFCEGDRLPGNYRETKKTGSPLRHISFIFLGHLSYRTWEVVIRMADICRISISAEYPDRILDLCSFLYLTYSLYKNIVPKCHDIVIQTKKNMFHFDLNIFPFVHCSLLVGYV